MYDGDGDGDGDGHGNFAVHQLARLYPFNGEIVFIIHYRPLSLFDGLTNDVMVLALTLQIQ